MDRPITLRITGFDKVIKKTRNMQEELSKGYFVSLNRSLDYMEQKRTGPHLATVPAIKASTVIRKMREPFLRATPATPLIRSGYMLDSLTGGAAHVRGIDSVGLRGWTGTKARSRHAKMSTPAPFPVLHQYGLGIRKRQFLFFDKTDAKVIRDFVKEEIKNKIEKAWA